MTRKESQRERERSNRQQAQFVGLSKKNNSVSQLSATGRKRRMGFGRRRKTSFTVHLAEDVLPGDVRLSKQVVQPRAMGKVWPTATDSGYSRKRVSTSSSIQRFQEVVPSFPPRSTNCSQRASSLNSISSSEGSFRNGGHAMTSFDGLGGHLLCDWLAKVDRWPTSSIDWDQGNSWGGKYWERRFWAMLRLCYQKGHLVGFSLMS